MCVRNASPYHPVCSYWSAQAVDQHLMSKVWGIFQTLGFFSYLSQVTEDNRTLFMFSNGSVIVCEVKPVQENSRRQEACCCEADWQPLCDAGIFVLAGLCHRFMWSRCSISSIYVFFFVFFLCVCSIYPGCKSDSRDFHHISAFVVDLLIKEHYNVYTLLLQAMAFCFSAKSDA